MNSRRACLAWNCFATTRNPERWADIQLPQGRNGTYQQQERGKEAMNKSQWILLTTFAASFYGVGNIWMTQFGWRLWPYVAPNDFGVYHNAWWAMLPCEKTDGGHSSPYWAAIGSPRSRCWDLLSPSNSFCALSRSGEVLSAFFQSMNSCRYAFSLSTIFPIIR